jgi:hypothetical protein
MINKIISNVNDEKHVTLGQASGEPITTEENRWNVPYSACSIVHKILNILVWNRVKLTNCKITCFEQKMEFLK